MKIVVVLHLFYNDMWEEFKNRLISLNTDFDLIVTMCEDNEDISDEIKETFPNVTIFKYPNKGLDIGPFLKVLKYLKENTLEYDYLIKLHTKKSHYNKFLGIAWRKELLDAIIGSKETLDKNLAMMEESEVKMCGSKKWVISTKVDRYTNFFKLPDIKEEVAEFVGGTMFIVDYNVMVDSFTIDELDKIYEQMPNGYKRDHSSAHTMERILGFVVKNKGYKVIGV